MAYPQMPKPKIAKGTKTKKVMCIECDGQGDSSRPWATVAQQGKHGWVCDRCKGTGKVSAPANHPFRFA
jgi:DnaJ-class molecular chaperone